jgi:hypothetical protein
MMKENV